MQYVSALGLPLPWLSDTKRQDAWHRWDVTWRDVIVTDERNRRVAVFNLTDHDLDFPEEYAALRDLLLDAAGER